MVYIKEILLEPVRITKSYYDVDDGDGLANFGSDSQNLEMKICESDYTATYYMTETIDPNTEFDDALFVNNMEQMAPFFIYGNTGSIIFTDNEFNENIGTTGGVIHIDQPDFAQSDMSPYIVIQDNKF